MRTPRTKVAGLVPLLLLALACLEKSKGQSPRNSDTNGEITPRLSGGSIAPEGRFPYMCSLRPTENPEKHVCGGTLIHPLWILTAAHCLQSSDQASLGLLPVAYCGIVDVKDNNPDLRFFVVDARLHEKWNSRVGDGHDLALLKLDREADLARPRLNIRGNPPRTSSLLGALGWGTTGTGSIVPDKLQVTRNLIVVSHSSCNKAWGGVVKKDGMLCAGIGEDDTCQGDSGGPLLKANAPGDRLAAGFPAGDVIYGVISFGVQECGTGLKPGVYTDVGYFSDWIQAVLQGKDTSTMSPEPSAPASPAVAEKPKSPDPPAPASPSPAEPSPVHVPVEPSTYTEVPYDPDLPLVPLEPGTHTEVPYDPNLPLVPVEPGAYTDVPYDPDLPLVPVEESTYTVVSDDYNSLLVTTGSSTVTTDPSPDPGSFMDVYYSGYSVRGLRFMFKV